MSIYTSDLDAAIAEALHEAHASFMRISCLAHDPDGTPTSYSVEITHRYRVDATTPVDALAAAMTGLRAAVVEGAP